MMLMRFFARQRHLTASLIAKSTFALSISLVSFRFENIVATSSFFQLLFFQTALAVFLSGSGFVKGVVTGFGKDTTIFVVSYLCFVSICSVLILGSFYLIPIEALFRASQPTFEQIFLVVLGAAAASLAPIFQGLLVSAGRFVPAYLPVTIFSILFTLIVLIPAAYTIDDLIILWVTSQVAIFLSSFAYMIKHFLSVFNFEQIKLGSIVELSKSIAVVGGLNGSFVFAIFIYREHWSSLNFPAMVSYVFFLNRISDLYMQVGFNAIASVKLDYWVERRRDVFKWLAVLSASVIIVAISILFFAPEAQAQIYRSLSFFGVLLVLHLLVDLLRAIAIFPTVYLLQGDESVAYGIVIILPSFVALAVCLNFFVFLGIYQFYVFLGILAILQILFFFIYYRFFKGQVG